MQLEHIPLRQIDCDPRFQVRLRWEPATDPGLDSLTTSLHGPEGLIHPIVVVRLLEATTFGRTVALIAGHRRLEAARRLGWETIPARVLPPCDLAMPEHHLQLLAIAVRENTERVELHPEDRREALRRLKALYEEVYPPARPGAAVNALEPPAPSFTRWAARVTKIPEHTIRRDLRRVLLTGALVSAAPVAPPPPEAPVTDRLQYAATAGQALTTALDELATALTPDICAALPEAQLVAMQQALQALQTALASLRERLAYGHTG